MFQCLSTFPQSISYPLKRNQDKNLCTGSLPFVYREYNIKEPGQRDKGNSMGKGQTNINLCYTYMLLVFNPLGHSKELLKSNFISRLKS